jgi:hypothetical protein
MVGFKKDLVQNEKFMQLFQEYVNAHAKLEEEWKTIRPWQFIKTWRNLHERQTLTEQYKRDMAQLGIKL